MNNPSQNPNRFSKYVRRFVIYFSAAAIPGVLSGATLESNALLFLFMALIMTPTTFVVSRKGDNLYMIIATLISLVLFGIFKPPHPYAFGILAVLGVGCVVLQHQFFSKVPVASYPHQNKVLAIAFLLQMIVGGMIILFYRYAFAPDNGLLSVGASIFHFTQMLCALNLLTLYSPIKLDE